jgi:hypothetical protein
MYRFLLELLLVVERECNSYLHRYPPLTPFEHYDHGKDADPAFPDLLPSGKVQVEELTPYIGSEVRGVQLSQLTKEGKDQLALFVAQRKVVGMFYEVVTSI